MIMRIIISFAAGKESMEQQTKKIRMIDIARIAGVSYAAVSAVLSKSGNQKIRVGAKTAEQIRKVAEELHFRPDPTAQMLAGKNSRIIGVMLDSYAPSPVLSVLARLETLLAEKEYRILVGQAHNNKKNFRSYLEDFKFYRTAGIVAFSHTYPQENFDLYKELSECANVILCGPQTESAEYRFPFVEVRWEDAYYELTASLLRGGCRRIALQLLDHPFFSDRPLAGYRRALSEHGIPFREELLLRYLLDMQPDRKDAAHLAETLSVLQCDAFLGNNQICALLIPELQKRGIRIPDDVALAGTNSSFLDPYLSPPLTNIDYNADAVADALFRLLMKGIEKKCDREEEIWIPAKVIFRESTGKRAK